MRVLFVNYCLPAYLHPLLERLVAKGCEIVMLLPGNDDNNIGEGVKLSDVQNISYKIRYSRSKKMWYGKHALIDLKHIIEQEQPDILLITYPYFLHLFFDRSIIKLLNRNNIRLVIREIPFQVPPFGKIKSYFSQRPLYNENMESKSSGILFFIKQWGLMHIRKYVYSKAAATMNYSTAAYDILPSYGVDEKNIHVTYNTTDTEALIKERSFIQTEPKILPPNNYRLLHVGRLVKWKRVDLLIQAVKKLVNSFPTLQLVIIGDGPEKENLIQQAIDNGIDSHILFAGGVHDPKMLGKYMNEATIYVLAGMGGLSINDAMTYGLPVVCSVCDSTERDLVRHGENGFFFKENDVNSLVQVLDQLLRSPELCKQMGEKSKQIIENEINLETVTNRYYQAFKEILVINYNSAKKPIFALRKI
ncbi:MAG: glycosyltransferase family 4 protein [Bacteroidetes bacterium]|nr:glycosyltransferase family 4 protein [Bacteroidota bacterium]MCL2303280.1 glycosyltransferase family 4 protein [Lentimicrobiaceae bacterium]